MATVKEFRSSSQSPVERGSWPDPGDPQPPAASARELLEGKCTVRFTIRLTDTLLGRLQKIAEDYRTAVSDLLHQFAARESARPAILGQTTSDAVADLERSPALARHPGNRSLPEFVPSPDRFEKLHLRPPIQAEWNAGMPFEIAREQPVLDRRHSRLIAHGDASEFVILPEHMGNARRLEFKQSPRAHNRRLPRPAYSCARLPGVFDLPALGCK